MESQGNLREAGGVDGAGLASVVTGGMPLLQALQI